MSLRAFAYIFGVVFLLVGIAGFIPALTPAHSHPDVSMEAFLGLELGLFPVNLLHNLVHLLFGLWALIAASSISASRVYFRSVAVIYALLAVLGLIGEANLHTLFGLVPLYGNNVWLHAIIAVAAGILGFLYRGHAAPTVQAGQFEI